MTALQIQRDKNLADKDLQYKRLEEEKRANRVNELISKINAFTRPAADIISSVAGFGGRVLTPTGAPASSKASKFDKGDRMRSNAGGVSYNKALNDINWHASNPKLLEQNATISWGTSQGTMLLNGRESAAGVACMDILFCPQSTEPNNYFNLKSLTTSLFAKVRSGKSGTAPYSGSDLYQVLFAVASAYAYLAWMTRSYRICNMPSDAQNLYVRQGLTTALNLSDALMTSDKAQFLAYINDYTLQLSKFQVPGTIPLFYYGAWLFSHVWRDSTGKGQFYLTRPVGFYEYDWDNHQCQLVPMPNVANGASGLTLSQIQNIGARLLGGLVNNSDSFEIMRADIKNAYGDEGFISLDFLDADNWMSPTMDKEGLEMFRNALIPPANAATVAVAPIVNGSMNLTQNATTGDLVFRPWFSYVGSTKPSGWDNLIAGFTSLSDQVVNLELDNPTVADTMLATRWKWTPTYSPVITTGDTTTASGFYYDGLNNVLPYGMKYWYFTISSTGGYILSAVGGNARVVNSSNSDNPRHADFHFRPDEFLIRDDNSGTIDFFLYHTANWDNTAPITAQVLQNMKKIDEYSLYGINLEA